MSEPISAFVSYSHDSDEHKKWVRQLAERLRRDGVDVILDQWHLTLGDALPLFMEQSIANCTYVLLICSEKYVAKANARIGGVGYETGIFANLILTAAQVESKGQNRLIPVVRQVSSPAVLPSFVAGRYYADLSKDSAVADQQYEELVRHLHKTPLHTPPPLGANPYSQPAATPSNLTLFSPIGVDERTLRRALRERRLASAARLVEQYPSLSIPNTTEERRDELANLIETHTDYLRVMATAASEPTLTSDLIVEEIELLA